jgi:glucokinase
VSQPVFGIDIGGTHLRVALADEQGRVLDIRKTDTDSGSGPEPAVRVMADMMRGLVQDRGWELSRVGAIGVGAPGPSDFEEGVVFTPPNLPKWRNVPLARMLTDATGIPTFLQNDANMAAYGELHQGAGKGARDMLFVTVSTGIGGGIVIDGHLYSGAGGTAGEVGHMVIDPNGPQCHCGARGCLEQMASGTAIARMARERLAKLEESSLATLPEVSATDVAEAAVKGDALALAVLHDAGWFLGLGLGSLLNILDPEILVLGGGAIQAGPSFLEPMRDGTRFQAFPSTYSHVRIVTAALGQDAGLVGAVEWARDHLVEAPMR